MSEFLFYLQQGVFHILDVAGADHMLFVTLLCTKYSIKDWKTVAILLTSFTIGHSISLILTSLGFRILDAQTVEFLIPFTIFLTGITNLLTKQDPKNLWGNYVIALGFGLIHGMGFSNFFSAMMMGISENIILPLLAFNIGIELGQLVIVAVFIGLSILYLKLGGIYTYWQKGVSILGIGISLFWMLA